jgi:small-conductance mechanosensitive channel
VWVADARHDDVVTSSLRYAIREAFVANRIEIPFPQHDVVIRTAGEGPGKRD